MWQVPAVQGNWPVMVTSQILISLYHYSRALLANTQLPTLSRTHTHTHSLSFIHTRACNTHSFILSLCVAFMGGGGGERTSQIKITSTTSDRLLNLFLGYILILVGKTLEITS